MVRKDGKDQKIYAMRPEARPTDYPEKEQTPGKIDAVRKRQESDDKQVFQPHPTNITAQDHRNGNEGIVPQSPEGV